MVLNLEALSLPIALRSATHLSDEALMRFSRANEPYKMERNHRGVITLLAVDGGIDNGYKAHVFGEFYRWSRQDGTGTVFSPSAGFNLPDTSCLSPDAAWLALERWNALTVKEQTGFPPLCPDFIIEVRSSSDSRRILEEKMQLWLDNGAKLAWLVDPIDANVTIYHPGQSPETLDRPATVAASGPVEGFVLDCTPLWPAA